jgi:acyl-CoA dehydrogenase
VLRPEQPIPIGELEQLTREALELGMLPAPDSDAGFGLWESCDRPSAMEFNIGILRQMAHANIGVAFVWQRVAQRRKRQRGPHSPLMIRRGGRSSGIQDRAFG